MEWISVKDRLPEKWLFALVAVCPPSQMNEVHIAYIDKNGKWKVLSEKGNHSNFITHWMPLPEPPKEVK